VDGVKGTDALAKLAIKQPVFIAMVLLAVTLVGASLISAWASSLPRYVQPVVMVGVSFLEQPSGVETQVTKLSKGAFHITALTVCHLPPARQLQRNDIFS